MSRIKRASRFCFAALLLFVVPALSLGAVPNRLGYQAALRDSAGQPLSGARPMSFAFYSDETSGDQILIEEQNITTTDGVMSVSLGAGTLSDGSGPGTYTTLEAVFRDYGDVWMVVRIDGEQLSPRIRVPSRAHALQSDTLDGLNYADLLRSDNAGSFAGSSLTIHSSSALDVNGSISLDGTVEMKTKGVDEDQEIWFYDNGQRGNEKIRWADSLDRFEFSDDTYTSGRISNGSSAYVEGNVYFNENGGNASRYVYFYDDGSSTGRSIRYDMTGPAFRFSADLEVDRIPYVREDLYFGAGGPAADRQIYFYDGGSQTGQSISWLDAEEKFDFSADFHTAGSIIAGTIFLDDAISPGLPALNFRGSPNSSVIQWDSTTLWLIPTYHFTAEGDVQTRAGALSVGCNNVPVYSCIGFDSADEWQTSGLNDLFIYDNLEVGSYFFAYKIHGGANSYLNLDSSQNVRTMFDDDFTASTTRAEWFHDGVYSSPYKLMEIQEDGDLRIRGTLSQNVAFDAAEMFLAAEPLQPGDVVALDPGWPGAVRKSSGANDFGVLGVVSEAPGFILGSAPFDTDSLREAWGADVVERFALEAQSLRAAAVQVDPDLRAALAMPWTGETLKQAGASDHNGGPFAGETQERALSDERVAMLERAAAADLERRREVRAQAEQQLESVALEKFFERNHVAVALAGRVPVAVDGGGGAILPGDSLVPSAVPGFAEKGDEDGIVIGIALEPFSGGQGKVLALVFPPTRGAGALSQFNAADRVEVDAAGAPVQAASRRSLAVQSSQFSFVTIPDGAVSLGDDGDLHSRGAFRPANTRLAAIFPVAEPVSAGDVVALDPVSYTHLTLPTN